MGKKSKKKKNNKDRAENVVDAGAQQAAVAGEKPKMKNKEYESELFKLQIELVKLARIEPRFPFWHPERNTIQPITPLRGQLLVLLQLNDCVSVPGISTIPYALSLVCTTRFSSGSS